MSALPRLFHLAASFPVLRPYLAELPSVDPEAFDLIAFDELVAARGGDASKQAAAFVLELWSGLKPWAVGPFRLGFAMRKWDHEQRGAFQAWAREPWLP